MANSLCLQLSTLVGSVASVVSLSTRLCQSRDQARMRTPAELTHCHASLNASLAAMINITDVVLDHTLGTVTIAEAQVQAAIDATLQIKLTLVTVHEITSPPPSASGKSIASPSPDTTPRSVMTAALTASVNAGSGGVGVYATIPRRSPQPPVLGRDDRSRGRAVLSMYVTTSSTPSAEPPAALGGAGPTEARLSAGISKLAGFGFNEDQARAALGQYNGDAGKALDALTADDEEQLTEHVNAGVTAPENRPSLSLPRDLMPLPLNPLRLPGNADPDASTVGTDAVMTDGLPSASFGATTGGGEARRGDGDVAWTTTHSSDEGTVVYRPLPDDAGYMAVPHETSGNLLRVTSVREREAALRAGLAAVQARGTRAAKQPATADAPARPGSVRRRTRTHVVRNASTGLWPVRWSDDSVLRYSFPAAEDPASPTRAATSAMPAPVGAEEVFLSAPGLQVQPDAADQTSQTFASPVNLTAALEELHSLSRSGSRAWPADDAAREHARALMCDDDEDGPNISVSSSTDTSGPTDSHDDLRRALGQAFPDASPVDRPVLLDDPTAHRSEVAGSATGPPHEDADALLAELLAATAAIESSFPPPAGVSLLGERSDSVVTPLSSEQSVSAMDEPEDASDEDWLVGLGFTAVQVEAALMHCGGDTEATIALLLTDALGGRVGGGDSDAAALESVVLESSRTDTIGSRPYALSAGTTTGNASVSRSPTMSDTSSTEGPKEGRPGLEGEEEEDLRDVRPSSPGMDGAARARPESLQSVWSNESANDVDRGFLVFRAEILQVC